MVQPRLSSVTRASAYRNRLLSVLTLILLFNYVDRWALGVVLQDVKSELHLSDIQLGVLSGIAFALFYSVMGIPIARWADRGDRVKIISLTTLLWSAAVALCGIAENFQQLMAVRIVVAIGEAGCIPAAYSLLADYFSRAERPRAAALYGMGGVLSAVVGYFVAGWLNQVCGWRLMFLFLALPGLALSVLAALTLREPRRGQTELPENSAVRSHRMQSPLGLYAVWRVLWATATFRHLLLCMSVMFFFNYGIAQWQPTFFIRSYALGTGELGTWLAVAYILGGVTGTYLGGELASRYAAGNEPLQLRALALVLGSSSVLSSLIYLSASPYWAFVLIALVAVSLNAANGPLLASIQTIVPNHLRAISFALVYFFANLIGMGLGPLSAGALSELLQPWAFDESLRYALLLLTPGYLLVGWYAWRASRTVAYDISVAQVDDVGGAGEAREAMSDAGHGRRHSLNPGAE